MAFGKKNFSIRIVVLVTLLVVALTGCSNDKPFYKSVFIQDNFFNGRVTVEKIEKLNKYRLTITDTITGESDRIYTPYKIFQMETADVNNDGKTDILIGIVKPTPFDPVLKKRLFIFQIDRDYIRPLWLSSRLVHPLEAFTVIKNQSGECRVHALEKISNKLYCIDEYRWASFGMTFMKTCSDSLTYLQAKVLLDKQN